MTKSSTVNSRRRGSAQPTDILEWHGLNDDRSIDYIIMLRQDALEPWEAACAIYPRPPEEFSAAMDGDEGRMEALLQKVKVGIQIRKLDSFTFREKKLIPTDKFLEWARKRGLVNDRLNGRIKRIRASTRGHSGSEIPSMRADNEILRAAISVFACEYKRAKKSIRGGKITKVLERYGELLFKDGEPPKSNRATSKLLNQCLKKLQNEFENINDYKGVRE